MEGVEGVIPFPNLYWELNHAEYALHKYRRLIRDSKTMSGRYVNTPLGITETNRDNWVLRRLILSGVDMLSQFDIMAFHQENRQNGITLNTPAFYGFSQLRMAWETLKNSVVLSNFFKPGQNAIRMPVGFFPGNIDLNAAISPSGQLRDKYYAIRKTNLFIESFEEYIGPSDAPFRSSNGIFKLPGENKSIRVLSESVGSKDSDAPLDRVSYWLPLKTNVSNSAILGLLNDKGKSFVVLPRKSIKAFGNRFPQYTKLTVPYEYSESKPKGAAYEKIYDMFIPINLPIWDSRVLLVYSTSEVLLAKTLRSKSIQRRVLVLYHFDKIEAETQLHLPDFDLTFFKITEGIRVIKESDDRVTFIYTHSKKIGSIILTKKSSSDELQVLSTINYSQFLFSRFLLWIRTPRVELGSFRRRLGSSFSLGRMSSTKEPWKPLP